MSKPVSAGLLLYRRRDAQLEVFLAHPGGPFFAKKDAGVWTIPKGLAAEDEDLLDAARREFLEETGFEPPGEFQPLQPVIQKSGKVVYAWAVEGDFDPAHLKSNTFPLEWPPKSGRITQWPEIDRAGWFTPSEAREKILPAQWPLVEELLSIINE